VTLSTISPLTPTSSPATTTTTTAMAATAVSPISFYYTPLLVCSPISHPHSSCYPYRSNPTPAAVVVVVVFEMITMAEISIVVEMMPTTTITVGVTVGRCYESLDAATIEVWSVVRIYLVIVGLTVIGIVIGVINGVISGVASGVGRVSGI
jgi:hypothetical protein